MTNSLTYLFLLFSLFILSITCFAQPINDICSGAIPLTPSADGTGCTTPTFTLPFVSDGTTDSGLGTECTGSRVGLDQFFTWTATSNALRWNDASPGFPGVIIYENTGTSAAPSCGAEVTCVGTFAATDHILSGWSIGDNLIFQIYDFENTLSNVGFCIEEACLPPEFTLSIDNSNCASDEYNIIVDLTSTGDATLVDISNNTNGAAFVDQGIGTYILTGFTGTGGDVTVTVGDSALNNCLSSKTITLPTGCPPPNDECVDAIAVTVGTEGDCSNQAIFNFPNASNSGEGVCNTSNGLSRPDVWFSFQVPASGHVKIIPGNVTGSVDLKIEVFEGTCSTLNSILCDPTLIGASPIIANRTPGETLFVRIWEEGATTNDYFICVHEINTVDPNDECVDAILLPTGAVNVCNTQTISIGNSSYSGEGNCSIGFGDIANDTWYSFIAPQSGIVNIQTFLNSNSSMDMHLEVFSGDCNSLISEACGGDGTNNINVTVFELTPNETFFLRIWEDFNDQTGTIDICISEGLPNVHNDCSGAKSLTVNATCVLEGMNNESTTASGEGVCTFEGGDDAPDVWASFAAPASGAVTIETRSGSLSDMSFEILTGTCANLQSIACDDDTGIGGMNLAHISNLTAGETVFIRIWESFGNQTGNFSICVKEVAAPTAITNNDCASATTLTFPTGVCTNPTLITSFGASQSAESNLCVDGYGGPQRDIWYKVAAPSAGAFTIEIETVNGSPLLVENYGIDVLTGSCGNLTSVDCEITSLNTSTLVSGLNAGEDVFIRIWGDGTEGELNLCITGPPSNDLCIDAIDIPLAIDCQSPTIGTTNSATTSPEGTCIVGNSAGEDVWYRFDGGLAVGKDVSFIVNEGNSAFAPVLEVFVSTTNSCADMTPIECFSSFSTAVVTIQNAQANQTFFLRIFDSFTSSAGTFSLCAVEQPINDPCSGAIPLVVNQGQCVIQTVGTNINMSNSPESNCTTGRGLSAADAWFTATIPASGNLVIETSALNGNFDTVIEAFIGSDCSNMTPVDCDDDDGDGLFSRIEIIGGTPNEQVFIRVWESFNNFFGEYNICASDPLLNDECSGAFEVSIAANKDACNFQTFNAIGASASPEFSACNTRFDDDVWLSFVATKAELIIDIPEFNVVAELYNLPTCGNLGGQILACHQRFPMLVDDLTVGQNYFLRLASSGEAPSILEEFNICIYEASVPANDDCSGAIPLTLGCTTSTSGTTALATFSNDGTCTELNGNNNATDVWFSVTAPPSGALLFGIDRPNFDQMGIEFYSGTSCANKVSLSCLDFSVDDDEVFVESLTPGETVFVRIWDVNIGFAVDGIFFDICVTDPVPANNNCVNATMLTTQPAPCFAPTQGTNLGANYENNGTCVTGGGTTTAKDVWYQATVPPSGNIIIRTSEAFDNSILNTVLEVYTGPDCNNLTSIACEDGGINDEFASVEITTEAPGTLLWIRVWEFDSDEFRHFNICAIEPPTSADECADAAEIAVHPDFCVDPVIASLQGASHSGLGSCTQGSGNSRPDIWFRLTVPASGNVNITTMNAGGLLFNNTAMEVFSGTCGNLTSIACNDNNSASNFAEVILTGQVPGSVLFIRIWNAAFIPIGQGFFYLCAVDPSTTVPVNDECPSATAITIQPGDCIDFFGGTDLNATSSTPLAGAPADCNNNYNDKDIWFKVPIPANFETNDYFFQFQFANGSSIEFEIYHGECNDLQFMDCISIPTSLLPLEFNIETAFIFDPNDILTQLASIGLSPGDDLIFRVWSIADGPALGSFCLRAENECIMTFDTDGDGVCDDVDNCIDDANPNQQDQDNDGIGDICDNCPTVNNPDQTDSDNNGIGDACENNCIANTTYSASPIPDSTIVSNNIIAGGTSKITDGQNAVFDAGNSVELIPTFEVELGGTLLIKTDGCVPE